MAATQQLALQVKMLPLRGRELLTCSTGQNQMINITLFKLSSSAQSYGNITLTLDEHGHQTERQKVQNYTEKPAY